MLFYNFSKAFNSLQHRPLILVLRVVLVIFTPSLLAGHFALPLHRMVYWCGRAGIWTCRNFVYCTQLITHGFMCGQALSLSMTSQGFIHSNQMKVVIEKINADLPDIRYLLCRDSNPIKNSCYFRTWKR